MDSDREIVETALHIFGLRPPEKARIMHIRNTLKVEEVEVSEPCLAEPRGPVEFKVVGAAKPISYDAEGNLSPL
jgi:hypothetical protein